MSYDERRIVAPPTTTGVPEFTWFRNLTDSDIPPEVQSVVSLGNKFNLLSNTVSTKDKIEVIKNVESNLYKVPVDKRNEVRQNVTQVIGNCIAKQKRRKHINHFHQQLEKDLKTTQEFRLNNPDVLFTVADKGNVTVALSRSSYVNKVVELLQDTTTYKPVNKDPTVTLIEKLKDLLKRWKKEEYLDNLQYHRLFLTSANLARAYALPKIHKPEVPFRIIVSSIGSPLHHFASFLQKVLSHGLNEPNYSVKNSLEFVGAIRNIHVPDNHCMISLDVSALFTSIPTDLILQSIESRWNNIQSKCNIPWSEMVIAVNLIVNSTFFKFNDKCYQQIDGTPMGSPISPIFAEFVMRDLENVCLSKLQFKPIHYCRYVDDIFTIVPDDQIQSIINTFNNYHNKLSFTHEMEADRSISFLDVKVFRIGHNISTNWYRKPTYSGRLLHYHSNNPISQKRAIVYGLVDKALLLSDPSHHPENIRIVRSILKQNCYPIHFINQTIKKRFTHLRHNSNNSVSNPNTENTDFIVLPYNPLFSNKLSNYFKSHDIKVIFKNINKLDSIVKKGKDTLPTLRQHNVVYCLKCKDCDRKYIGQTLRALETRVKEHKNNIKNLEKHNTISSHRIECQHDMDWENPKILDVERNKYKRDISEMLHIKINNCTLNVQKETEKLSEIYLSIF